MFQESVKIGNFVVFFNLFIITGFQLHTTAVGGIDSQRNISNISLNRNHVSVWFDSPLKGAYRYRKFNLAAMVKLVSGTFGAIAIPSVPSLPTLSSHNELTNTKVLIPSIVAEHNKNSAPDKSLEAIVSFEVASNSESNVNDFASFIVAKNYAEEANVIYPGTVKTLLLHNENSLRVKINTTDASYYLNLSRKLLKNRSILNKSRGIHYKLGITISLDICGNKKGTQINSYRLLKRLVDHVDLVVPILYVKSPFQNSLQLFEVYEMQIAAFTTCEQIVKKIKQNIEIIPLVIFNPPNSHENNVVMSKFLEYWQLMSSWAEGNNRKVIMYQAFDTFESDFVKGGGWWRMKNENIQYFTESSFVEKAIGDLNPRRKIERNGQPTSTTFFDSRIRLASSSEPDVCKILQSISTQFSTIVTNQESVVVDSLSSKFFKWLPEVVANFNVENLNASIFKPLAVISTFTDNIPINTDDVNHEFSYNPKLALRVANSANKIFPGTVTTLVYDGLRGSEFIPNLSKLNETMNSGLGRKIMDSGIRLGVFADLVACHQHLNSSIGIDWIDLFIIDLRGLISSSTQLIMKLTEGETCIKMLQKSYSQAQSMFAVNCSDFVGNSADDIEKCNKILNDWAKEKNIELILSHEFIVPPPVDLRNENNKQFLQLSSWVLTASGGFIFILILAVAMVIIQTLRLQRSQMVLSRIEQAEFFDGVKDAPSIPLDLKDAAENAVMSLKYDAKKFEIPKQDFRFDADSTVLGKGNYGVVYKLFISKFQADVAVKVPHSDCSKSTLKSLLSEIKIMSFVEENKHIVQFLGAYTQEIQRGIVYIVTELCEMGSLQSYLFTLSKSNLTPVIFDELVRFCFEIALGMQFISEKGVIHGDLSTRNVLLGHNATCKISDFGLSKKLYQYEIYTKKQQEALPWRWLAIETLKRMEFSTKSDAWAFGVTVWEIFSFGDLPYPGQVWNFDFVEALESGMRMKQPKIAPNEIFTKMQECWNKEKDGRPTFNELVNFFQGLRGNEYILT